MSIWAHHAHVFPAEIRPDGTIAALLECLDRCEIERAVAFAPFVHQVKELAIEPNAWLAEALRAHSDRLFGFGTVDVGRGGMDDQIEHLVELGFKGIKLHPAAQRFHILFEPLLAVYAAAERHNLLLVFHTVVHRHRIADFRLVDFDEIAWRFPKLRFTLEHVGGYAFFREAVAVIQNNAHQPHATGTGTVYAGLTTVFSPKAPHWYLAPAEIAELIFCVGAKRVLFGLDFPYNQATYLRDAIGTIRQLDISDADKEAILGGNLRTLLGAAPA